MEAGLTIGVGATLVGAALTGGLDAGNAANVAVAKEQAGQIAQAVTDFVADLKTYPGYKDGNATGPLDNVFDALISENGTYPSDNTSGSWSDVPTGSPYSSTNKTLFGHVVDVSKHDSIEGQLNRANVATPYTAGADLTLLVGATTYPRKGFFPADPTRGHALNYVKNDKILADPWSHKYIINTDLLSVKRLKELKASSFSSVTEPLRTVQTACAAFIGLAQNRN